MRMSRRLGLYRAKAGPRILYDSGTVNTGLVGSLTAYAYVPSTSGSTATKPTVTKKSGSIKLYLSGDGGGDSSSYLGGSYFADNKISLTNYKTLKIAVTSASSGDGSGGYVRFGVTASKANKYTVAEVKTICSNGGTVSNKTLSLDVSNLTGAYYLFICLYGSYEKEITFTKWWLE